MRHSFILLSSLINTKGYDVTNSAVYSKQALTRKYTHKYRYKTVLYTNIVLYLSQEILIIFPKFYVFKIFNPEAATRRCSVVKVLLEISQNSQEKPVPEFLLLQNTSSGCFCQSQVRRQVILVSINLENMNTLSRWKSHTSNVSLRRYLLS